MHYHACHVVPQPMACLLFPHSSITYGGDGPSANVLRHDTYASHGIHQSNWIGIDGVIMGTKQHEGVTPNTHPYAVIGGCQPPAFKTLEQSQQTAHI
jgi:hypothetical protein